MKTAVVYYSMSGNTAQIAETIAAQLDADLIRIEPTKAYPSTGFKKFLWGGKSAVMGERPALEPYRFGAYERVIIGTPVWASNMAPPIRSFIAQNKQALAGAAVAAFVCCSGGGADKALGKIKGALGTDALSAEMALIDPKDKPDPQNAQKIAAFVDALK